MMLESDRVMLKQVLHWMRHVYIEAYTLTQTEEESDNLYRLVEGLQEYIEREK